jgi:hypothetical protein
MDQIEQAVMYALGPQVDPNLKQQVRELRRISSERVLFRPLTSSKYFSLDEYTRTSFQFY